MAYNYVFGPVRSGRLGLSLGLDMTGAAVCTLDCVYCEVGRTTRLTTERKPYVPAAELLGELARWKADNPEPLDFVTLGGMGEPTLSTELGAVIHGARDIFPDTPVAVLTNSTLLHDPAVRRELALADAVLPSLDTLVPAELRRLNRPHADVDATALLQGLVAFREEFDGLFLLEVLLVAGINDTDANLARIKDAVAALEPHRIDVVSMTRPGTLDTARPVPAATLAHWRETLAPLAVGMPGTPASTPGPRRDRHIFSDAASGAPADADTPDAHAAARDRVAASIGRRPQTAAQLAEALGVPLSTVRRVLEGFRKEGRLTTTGEGDDAFHALRRG